MANSDQNSSSDDRFYGCQAAEVNQDKRRIQFSDDEVELIIRMYKLVGKRWSLIAGRIPGRSAEEIEKYFTGGYLNTLQIMQLEK